MATQRPGLRERKKQQTRDAIALAAGGLFCARGYEATTLAEIAEAAGVSTRTIFAYFPSKEDILFEGFQVMRDGLARALQERPAGKDALGTLRDFIVETAAEKRELDLELAEVVARDETLQSHKRARLTQLGELVAAAIAVDLGCGADDLRPQVAAASLTAAFEVLERQGAGPSARLSHGREQVAAGVDPIIAFVRAGLEALPAPAPAAASH